MSLVVGGTTQSLTATMLDQFGNSVTGTSAWTSDASGVASVGSSSGVVTPVSAGTANVTASSGGITSNASVVTVSSGGGDGGGGPDYTEIFADVTGTLALQDITTNLNGCAGAPDACVGLYFEKTGDGRVTFTASLNLTDEDTQTFLQSLGDYMEASAGSMKFDATTATLLKNAGAQIALYNLNDLGFTGVPNIVVKDDDENIILPTDPDYPVSLDSISYDAEVNGGTLTFDASHFTTFDTAKVINTNTGVGYDTIQEAIDEANDGDIINVAAGTYVENVDVTKSLTLQGSAGTIIRPGSGTAVNINEVDDVTIDGFEIDGHDTVTLGIYAFNSNGTTVKNNNVHNIVDNDAHNAGIGIIYYGWGQGIDNAMIQNNTVSYTDHHGIWIGAVQSDDGVTPMISNGNTIENNIVHHTWQNTNELPQSALWGGAIGMDTAHNATIHNNSTDNTGSNMREIMLINGFDTVSITDNTLVHYDDTDAVSVDWMQPAIEIASSDNSNLTLTGNNITVNVGVSSADGWVVWLPDVGGTSSFSSNTITLAGSAPPSFLHGLVLSDALTGDWTVEDNTLQGDGLGPNSVGIRLYDSLPATSNISITSNQISGWANGIRSNALANAGLVTVHQNSITGNSLNGLLDGGSTATIDATENWWGTAVNADILTKISGSVTYKPYYTTSTVGDSGILSDIKAITAFTIPNQSGSTTIDQDAHTIAITMPYGTNVTALVSTFTTTGAGVSIAGTSQVSATTANDFTSAKTYRVTAIDETTLDYTVTVTVALNPAKAITAFSFPSGTGVINESDHTITVNVPFGTNVTALVATFTTTGAGVSIDEISQVSGTTANNFTTSKTYWVTAANSDFQDYVVTVTVLEDTQTSPDSEGDATSDSDNPEVVITDPDQAVDITITSGTDNPTVDVSSFMTDNDEETTGTLPGITINSDVADVVIPDNTVVTGPSGWDGVIDAPTEGTPAGGNPPAGFSVGSTVISIGSDAGTLTFDTPVTIILTGVTGTVGYRPAGSNTWQTITNVCASPYATPGDPPAGSECTISNGTDTKIVTFHFTSFGSLNVVSSGGNNNGGGGDGGGFVPTPTPTPTPTVSVTPSPTPTVSSNNNLQPTVLGASTVSCPVFTQTLAVGSTGKEVTELQNRLTSEDVYTGPITGYFGTLTKAGVIAFQKKNNIDQVGVVGPKTRALLNVCSGKTEAQSTAQSTVLGESTFKFMVNLGLGMKNGDVTELQNRLTKEGVYSGPVTGYFGALTEAGVKAYQTAHPSIGFVTGFVGTLTRAELNK